MRRILDTLYAISGGLAALFICLICVLVCTQVTFNIITKTGLFGLNLTIPSYADFAGYFLAASTFLALAYTLRKGGHIRVTLLTGMAGDKIRFALEVFALTICAATALFMVYHMAGLTLESWEFGDVSSGIVAVPLFIPQLAILLGLVIFMIALIDLLVQTIRARRPVIVNVSPE
jgi:TRAP-type C4-dicarboxylate transport system permease small subunit